MKILFFAGGGDIGGGKTHILSLAKKLGESNEVLLLSFREGVFCNEAKAMGINTIGVNHKKGSLYSIGKALSVAKEFKPDIVHCHGSKSNAMGLLVKTFLHLPVVTTIHSDPKLDYMGRTLAGIVYGGINAVALRGLDYYVAVAGRMKKLLIQRGFNPQRIYTVFNGLDFDGSTGVYVKKDPGVINIGIAARLTPVKDIDTLIKAFAIAYNEDNRLRLRIAGTGEDEEKLRELAQKLGVIEKISFVGWVDDVKSFFKEIDINVLCSLSETFPYSLLEGTYEHCPAIASNVGGIPYLIENEKTGLLFECGDAQGFAKQILRLAKDEALRKKLADNLYDKAKEKFSLARMKQDQEEIYKSILDIEAKKHEKNSIVICGAYGKGNSGDESILDAIINEVKDASRNADIFVMSRKPRQTQINHEVGSFYIFNLFSFLLHMKKAKVFISGGGSLIQDVTSTRSLYFYLYTLKSARKNKCFVTMYGCGVGPLLTKEHEQKTAEVLNSCVDIITLRDEDSMHLLNKIGVTNPKIILAADPALNLMPKDETYIDAILASAHIPLETKKIAFCVRQWDSFKNYKAVARAAEYAYKEWNLLPVFIPIEAGQDIDAAEQITKHIAKDVKYCIIKQSLKGTELIGIFKKCTLVVGMRLHSLIFAVAAQTNVIGLSYDVKVTGFMNELGTNLCINVEDVTEEALCGLISKAVQQNESVIAERSAALKERELLNRVVLKEILR